MCLIVYEDIQQTIPLSAEGKSALGGCNDINMRLYIDVKFHDMEQILIMVSDAARTIKYFQQTISGLVYPQPAYLLSTCFVY